MAEEIKDIFIRLANATKGVHGSAIILNAAADLRYIAEEQERTIRALESKVKELEGQVKILTGGLEKMGDQGPSCNICNCWEIAKETLTASAKWVGRKE